MIFFSNLYMPINTCKSGLSIATINQEDTLESENEVNYIHSSMCSASSNPDNDLDRTTGGERGDMPSYAASAMRCCNHIISTTIKAVLHEDERAETMSVPVHKESKPKGVRFVS